VSYIKFLEVGWDGIPFSVRNIFVVGTKPWGEVACFFVAFAHRTLIERD
jgi:hypothetical protein